jgi:hypothetical protein
MQRREVTVFVFGCREWWRRAHAWLRVAIQARVRRQRRAIYVDKFAVFRTYDVSRQRLVREACELRNDE